MMPCSVAWRPVSWRVVAGRAATLVPMFISPHSIKHCKVCGGAVAYAVPADDNRERATCTVCHTVHYENPLNVVGTVPT